MGIHRWWVYQCRRGMPGTEGKQEAGIEGGKGHINKYVTIDNRAQAPEGSMS